MRAIRAIRRFFAGSTETPDEVAAAVDDVHHRVDDVHRRFDDAPR